MACRRLPSRFIRSCLIAGLEQVENSQHRSSFLNVALRVVQLQVLSLLHSPKCLSDAPIGWLQVEWLHHLPDHWCRLLGRNR